MDRLREALLQIQTQLGVLNRSQRIAIALCSALVVVSLLWLMKWSTDPELVPLLTRKVADVEELAAIREQLRGRTFKVAENQVFVKAGEKQEIILDLSVAGALPTENTWNLDTAATQSNPFVSPEQRLFQHNVALGNSLASVLMASPLIHRADVKISPRSFRRIGRSNDVPTAAVSLHMARGKGITREMVRGWAELVAGSVPGLKAHNVTILDALTGESSHVPRPEDAMNSEYLEHVKDIEDHVRAKILNVVRIPDAMVEVAVDLDTDRSTVKTITLGKPQKQEETTDKTTSGRSGAPAEAGTRANTGVALGGVGGGVNSSTEKEESRFYPPTIEQEELTSKAGFSVRQVTATVSIPRSYIVGLYKNKNPGGEEPTDQDLDADRTEQLNRIRKIVSTIIQSSSAVDVNVDVYPDMIWTASGGSWSPSPGAATAMAVEASGGAGTVELLTRYGPQGALACLALASMFMMMRIVRKSAAHMPPIPVDSTSDEELEEDEESDEILAVGTGAVGQAQRGDSFLTAKELDEDMLHEIQITSEVSRMVEDDPEAAAELLKSWIVEAD